MPIHYERCDNSVIKSAIYVDFNFKEKHSIIIRQM